jgi:Cdc6-like AAA superfamily ATPase
MSSNKSMLPDEAEENATKFGFDDYSALIASVIKDKELQTPFTIAIYGEWGSGKTTLMKTVANKLKNGKESLVGVSVVWFNAWEFEKLSLPLWAVFLNRIIMGLRDLMPDEKLKDQIKALGKGFVLLSANALLSKAGTKQDIEEIKEKVWNDIENVKCIREKLSDYLEKALKNNIAGNNRRLVVFVDDLDRCLPEQCVDIFEAIKLFLNCKNCIFVIGADKNQIKNILDQKYQTKNESKNISYIEKFVQLEFDLPPKTPDEVKEFLIENASLQLKLTGTTLDLIAKFIDPNPRKIKRWLNSVLFLEKLFLIKQTKMSVKRDVNVSLASIWLFLKSFFPDFANKISENPAILNLAISLSQSKGDSRKIGDFELDNRLAEFLSLLKPTYDKNQLTEIIYLSKSMPVADFSILTEELQLKLKQANAQLELGIMQSGLDNDQAIESFEKSLKLFYELKNDTGTAEALYHLAKISSAYSEKHKFVDILYNLLIKKVDNIHLKCIEESPGTDPEDKWARNKMHRSLRIYFVYLASIWGLKKFSEYRNGLSFPEINELMKRQLDELDLPKVLYNKSLELYQKSGYKEGITKVMAELKEKSDNVHSN